MHELTSVRRSLRRRTSAQFIGFSQVTATRLCRILLHLRGGFTVKTYCPIDPYEQYLFVANHQSRLDPFAAFAVLPLKENRRIAPARFMTAKSIYYSPLLPFLKSFGCYPTKNYDLTVADSVDFLKQGYNLFIFPEGRRTLRSESNPRPGVSSIIQKAKLELPLQLILIHLEWEKKSFGRRHVTVSLVRASDDLLEKDAQGIMAAVYDV